MFYLNCVQFFCEQLFNKFCEMENQGESQKRTSTAAFEEHFDISDDEVAPSQTKITKPSSEMVNTPKLRERIKILVSFFIVYIFCIFTNFFVFSFFSESNYNVKYGSAQTNAQSR